MPGHALLWWRRMGEATPWAGHRSLRRAAAGLLIAITAFYILVNTRDLMATRHQLAAHGRQIELDREDTDPFGRDVLKAFEIRYGTFWKDPNSLTAAYWYPFAGPTVAAAVQRLVGWDMHSSYLLAGVLLTAVGWLAMGLWTLRWAGLWGVVAFLIVRNFESGVFPANTSPVARIALLWSLCLLFEADQARRRRWVAAAGGAVGLLGLWHGSSFFWGIALSLFALLLPGKTRAKGSWWRRFVSEGAVWAAVAAVPLSLLIVPQLVVNGEVVDHEAARLYLWDLFHEGRDWSGFFSLTLLPAGWDLAALLLVVGLAVWRGQRMQPTQRRILGCLAATWLLCAVETKLGFIVHADPPMVGRLATRLLIAPAHTWYLLGLWVLRLTCAACVGFAADTVDWSPARWRGWVGGALAAGAVFSAATAWRERIPFKALPTVSLSVVRFAERVADITHDTTVLFGGPLAHYALVKAVSPGLWRNYVNPRIFDQSLQWQNALVQAGLQGDDALYRRAREAAECDYMIEDTRNPANEDFAARCGAPPALAESGNLRLLPLKENCTTGGSARP